MSRYRCYGLISRIRLLACVRATLACLVDIKFAHTRILMPHLIHPFPRYKNITRKIASRVASSGKGKGIVKITTYCNCKSFRIEFRARSRLALIYFSGAQKAPTLPEKRNYERFIVPRSSINLLNLRIDYQTTSSHNLS